MRTEDSANSLSPQSSSLAPELLAPRILAGREDSRSAYRIWRMAYGQTDRQLPDRALPYLPSGISGHRPYAIRDMRAGGRCWVAGQSPRYEGVKKSLWPRSHRDTEL